MDVTAASEGPAQGEALPESVEVEAIETEADEDQALAEVYRKLTAEPEEPEAPEAGPDPEPEKPEEPPPSELPAAIRNAWAGIPKDARDAFVTAQRDMSRKLSDQGRLIQGVAPIRDALVSASRDIPSLMNMRPEQVATEVLELARISHQFNEKPLETLIGLARQHGIEAQLRQAFTGQPPQHDAQHVAALQKELAAVKQQLGRVVDPEYLREQVSQVTKQERVMSEVAAFADKAEHWKAVEDRIQTLIPAIQAKLGDGASPQDVLAQAYDLALQLYLPEAKAQVQAAKQASTAPDPEKAAQAQKAKSINVKGAVSGKPREMTEDERYAAAFRRASQK